MIELVDGTIKTRRVPDSKYTRNLPAPRANVLDKATIRCYKQGMFEAVNDM
jgi:hypothetical protein